MTEHRKEIKTALEVMAALCELPEDGLLEHGVTLVSWMDTEGVQQTGWAVGGDPMLQQTLGLMLDSAINIKQESDAQSE